MRIYDREKKLIIETFFPQDEFDSYLFQVDATDDGALNRPQIEKIFLLARSEFNSGKLGLDPLADICNFLFGKSQNIKGLKLDLNDKLSSVLLSGSELIYYSRRKDVEGLKLLIDFLVDVQKYKKSI